MTHLILLLLNVNGAFVADGDITDDEIPLLGVVEGVDCLLETVRDDDDNDDVVVLLLFVVVIDSDTAVAVVTGIAMVLFELMLCDLVGSLRGDGGTCSHSDITCATTTTTTTTHFRYN